MKFEIKHKLTGNIIFSMETKTFRLCIEAAIKTSANLSYANLRSADLRYADLRSVDLSYANLSYANLSSVDLRYADISYADLRYANLRSVDLSYANLSSANLSSANLRYADLRSADLRSADLRCANLSYAYLRSADLRCANLSYANLSYADGMLKILGVTPGNKYWKRFGKTLKNNDFQFILGLNKINGTFAADERVLCSYPGFHFASRSWCAVNYPERPLEALILIPEGAQINEPWASDGNASADMIEILQIFDTTTGEDITYQFKGGGQYDQI